MRMRGWILLAVGYAYVSVPMRAQSVSDAMPQWQKDAGGKMAFEIVSVKENKAAMGPDNRYYRNFPWGSTATYVPTGGHLIAKNVTLLELISFAYKLTGQQITHMLQPAMPSWALQNRYDVEGKAAESPEPAREPTKDQMRLMVQAVLADRFQLKMHYEAKGGTVHVLRIVQPDVLGPNLKPHPADVDCSKTWTVYAPGSPVPQKPTDGLPATCSTIEGMEPPVERLHYAARGILIDEIVKMSALWYDDGRPVLDETGLKGTYDMILIFAPPANTPLPSAAPMTTPDATTEAAAPVARRQFINAHGVYGKELQQALKSQLGLTLENSKGPVESLVIDHLEEHPAGG